MNTMRESGLSVTSVCIGTHSERRSVKNIELIELTLEQLGGEPPTAGAEVRIDSRHFRILEVKPPKTRSSKWRRRAKGEGERKWQLLVEKMD